MPLSKHHIDTNTQAVPLDCDLLARELEDNLPRVTFAYLHGSAATCTVSPHSDIDIALFVHPEALAEERAEVIYQLHETAQEVTEHLAPGFRCDLGILNSAEPILRYEVLKGRLLFCRDRERWLRFYSLTCREYESQLFHYEKQHRYRLEASR